MTDSKTHVEITGLRITGKQADLVADGYVEGPASDLKEGHSYTFEAEVKGVWYRWTGQWPIVEGDRFRISLYGGTPFPTPTDL